MLELEEAKLALIDIGESLYSRGYSAGSTGNISVRFKYGFVMTPTNTALGRLRSSELSIIDPHWKHTAGAPPSKEIFMHRAMYVENEDVNSVIHLHSTYVTALSCLSNASEHLAYPYTPYLTIRAGRNIPLIEYRKPGSPELAKEIQANARGAKVMILKNHGSLVTGKTLEEAMATTEELETSAKLALLLNGHNAEPLSGQDVKKLL